MFAGAVRMNRVAVFRWMKLPPETITGEFGHLNIEELHRIFRWATKVVVCGPDPNFHEDCVFVQAYTNYAEVIGAWLDWHLWLRFKIPEAAFDYGDWRKVGF